MTGRTIAIGDIHGCSQALRAVVDAIELQTDDRLVLLGDYVDRGPDSRGVVEMILQLRQQCEVITLLGNHELMLLNGLQSLEQLFFWLSYGGQQTVDSYGGDVNDIPEEHLDFFRGCRLHYATDSYLFVHANYAAELELAQQSETVLLWTHLTQQVPAPHRSGKTAIVGHTPQVKGEVLDIGHLICIDTYCCGGRWLTALDVDERQVWQADMSGMLRPTHPPKPQ